MIAIMIECNHCGKKIEKKYSWLRDFNENGLGNFYTGQGFSDDYLLMDVCSDCKEKFEDISFRE
jgi:DNA-directed RNA polymerase subunit RPC12/RpoP